MQTRFTEPAAGVPLDAERAMTAVFGANVFDDGEMRKRLSGTAYQRIQDAIGRGEPLDLEVADTVAEAMKEWAVERGATHFTHWFQPLTGLTAEKHDSFLKLSADRPVLAFSGKQLVQGEPDASSFPSGGIRETYEARGYTAWDPSSPAFIRESRNGATLFIPTVFCSYLGEALDKKTPLLRSGKALSKQAVRLLHILGHDEVSAVHPTVGPEQEYFLIDREYYELRPDLVATGRTLVGARPPKGQELDDHYFGTIKPRALAFMEDIEQQLWKLGVPATTRHNEVAPSQFELAPIFEKSSVATDHNMLVMDVLRKTADDHGLVCLLHEKPFAGLNGSGKHNNWSLATDTGENLFEPTDDPRSNKRFLVFLAAVVRGIDKHADLMRISIASHGNDHRLGANEAPPAIISIYVGDELDGVINRIAGKRSEDAGNQTRTMRLGAMSVPHFRRDNSDRNRTSPFAFTGNKWEFRAVASSQSIAEPNVMINTIAAESFGYMADELERLQGEGKSLEEAIDQVVHATLAEHGRVIFNGNNYSDEWVQEAERRGLPHYRNTVDALDHYLDEKNIDLFADQNVLNPSELQARSNVGYERYAKAIAIEAQAMINITESMVVPTAIEQQTRLARSLATATEAGATFDLGPQRELLDRLGGTINELIRASRELDRIRKAVDADESPLDVHARRYREEVIPAMDRARAASDLIETMVDDDLWPLPKYWQMLFLS